MNSPQDIRLKYSSKSLWFPKTLAACHIGMGSLTPPKSGRAAGEREGEGPGSTVLLWDGGGPWFPWFLLLHAEQDVPVREARLLTAGGAVLTARETPNSIYSNPAWAAVEPQ